MIRRSCHVFSQQQEDKESQMSKSVKWMFATSITAVTLAAMAVPAAAAEPTMPNQQMMSQGQAQGGGTPCTMPCYGPGMMGGGYGPGMMGGGYGPGMMGGGYGPGMMGGGYGPGMMGAYGQGPAGLNLTPDQISKIEKIREELFKANEPLARQMFQERNRMQEAYMGGQSDPEKMKKAFSNMSDLQKKMFDAHVNAQKKMDDVLTKEQRQKMRNWGGGMMGY
jgi:Spy/CpxP family protein refolding chaperone